MANDSKGNVGSGTGPFDGGPFQQEGAPSGGGLLDDLRLSGEQAVDDELSALHAAMTHVDAFAATVADADLEALRAEWKGIETELKRALQSGLTAVEEKGGHRRQASVDDEFKAVSTELARKNDLISQLSDTVKKLNTELDEKDRRLRDELRTLKDRLGSHEDELSTLRTRAADLEHGRSRTAKDLESVNAERDALKVGLAQATEALEVERAHQEERHAELEKELNESRLSAARLENEKRDAERRASDLEKRLAVADRAREKADQERAEKIQELGRIAKEAKASSERVIGLEAELATQKERIDKDVRRLQRHASRLRGDAETYRSRVADAVSGFRGAISMLDNLPKELPPDDEAEEGAKELPAGP